LSAAPAARWAQVDLRGLRVERVREFGQIYLALSLWRRLGLHTLLQELLAAGQEDVPWELTACNLTVAPNFLRSTHFLMRATSRPSCSIPLGQPSSGRAGFYF